MEGNALEEKHTPHKQDRSLFHLPAWLRHSGEHTHAHTHTHTHTRGKTMDVFPSEPDSV